MKQFFSGLFCTAIALTASATQTSDSIPVLDEIVVTGTRTPTSLLSLPHSVTVISRDKITQSRSSSLLPLLSEQVPGLFITRRGMMGYGVSGGAAGAMSMRGVGGTPTTGMLVLIDGQPNYMGLMGHPLADAYNSAWAERVEVVSGPASVLYGSNAMGGVINIITRESKEEGAQGTARLMLGSHNTISTEATVQKREGRVNGLVSLNADRSDGHRSNSGHESQGGYAKIGYTVNSNWELNTSLNLTRFDAVNPGTITTPLTANEANITRGTTGLSIENKYERMAGGAKLYYNWGRHRINDGHAVGAPPPDYLFRSKDFLLGASLYEGFNLFAGNYTTVGVDLQHFGGEAWNAFHSGARTDIGNETINEAAAYVDVRQSLSSRISVNAGLRADHHEKTGMEWIPAAGAAYIIGNSHVIKVSASKGYRNPTLREMYLFPPQNSELKPERLMNYELSYAGGVERHGLSYRMSVYYLNGDNMIQTLPVGGRPLNVNTGKVENWGIEASGSYRPAAAWRLSANYCYLNMQHKVVAAPKHKAFFSVDYTRDRFRFDTRLHYINNLFTSITRQTATTPEQTTKDTYSLCDASISYRANPWVELFTKVENIFGTEYEINRGFPMPKTTFMAGLTIKM